MDYVGTLAGDSSSQKRDVCSTQDIQLLAANDSVQIAGETENAPSEVRTGLEVRGQKLELEVEVHHSSELSKELPLQD